MKAIVRDRYGSPDVLRLEEIEKPPFGDNELLVKVHAASVSASDWEGLTGTPLYARLFGLLKPRIKILGSDFAGHVEAVGRNVKQFRPGDDVFGDTMGCGCSTFAEYVSVPENAPVALKPASMSFEEAATRCGAALSSPETDTRVYVRSCCWTTGGGWARCTTARSALRDPDGGFDEVR